MILLNHYETRNAAYVEIHDDGRVTAGAFKDTAKTYESAEEAYAVMRQSESGLFSKSVSQICEALERYMEQKDDGR